MEASDLLLTRVLKKDALNRASLEEGELSPVHPTVRPVIRKLAKCVTNVGSPPFTFFASALFFGSYLSQVFPVSEVDSSKSLISADVTATPYEMAFIVGILGGLIPLLVLLVLRLSGVIQTLDLSSVKERVVGFGLAIACGLLTIPYLVSLKAPVALVTFVYANIFGTLLFFLLTLYTMRYNWKVSVHAGGAASLAFIVLLCYGRPALFWASFSILCIGWSRIFLSRHSHSEVIAGVLLGFGSYATVFYFMNEYSTLFPLA